MIIRTNDKKVFFDLCRVSVEGVFSRELDL